MLLQHVLTYVLICTHVCCTYLCMHVHVPVHGCMHVHMLGAQPFGGCTLSQLHACSNKHLLLHVLRGMHVPMGGPSGGSSRAAHAEDVADTSRSAGCC